MARKNISKKRLARARKELLWLRTNKNKLKKYSPRTWKILQYLKKHQN